MKGLRWCCWVLLMLWLSGGHAGFVDDLLKGRSKTTSRAAADAAYVAENNEVAARGYEEWVRSHPEDAEAWFRLGNLYSKAVRPMDALAAYRAAQKLNPADSRAWHNMGMLHLRMAVESYDGLRRNAAAEDPLVPYADRVLSRILEVIALRIEGGNLKPLKELVPSQQVKPAEKP